MAETLDVLPNVPRGQLFVCISFLSDKENKNVTLTGIRIGGVFETYEAACKHAKEIQELDDRHHVFVGEVGKWLPYDPNPDSEAVEDAEYANKQLNELMKGHKDNMEKARIFHEMRKNEKLLDNVNDNLENKNRQKEELTQKLSKVKSIDEAQTLTKSLENLDSQIKEMEGKLSTYKTNDQALQQELGDLQGNATNGGEVNE